MPGVARAHQDHAGDIILQGSSNVIVNGLPASRIGDPIAGHGRSPHSGPVMVQGSSTVMVNGIPVSRQGDLASCGHAAFGSPDVQAD